MASTHWNVFRYIADISHTLSKCILMWAIHRNKSAEGVSLITQFLYLVVFLTRYLPFPFTVGVDPSGTLLWWNTVLKLFYIISSAYILAVMLLVFARTREREGAWKLGAVIFLGSMFLAPFTTMIFRDRSRGRWTVAENSWVFSIILESVCVLPQLLLLRQTSVPTVIDSFYLVTLGAYRFFYLLNWIVQGAQKTEVDPIAIIFGVIETLVYVDFFYVYWSMPRIKLRGGKIIDSEDLDRGWLVKRFIARKPGADADEEHAGLQNGGSAPSQRTGRGWGWQRTPRGLSVSADQGLDEATDRDARGFDDEDLASPELFEDAAVDEDRSHTTQAERNDDILASGGSEWREHQENTG